MRTHHRFVLCALVVVSVSLSISCSGSSNGGDAGSGGGSGAGGGSAGGAGGGAGVGCTNLTVKDQTQACSVGASDAGSSYLAEWTLCVAPGSIPLTANALFGHQLGAAPWHDTANDTGAGDPGTRSSDAGSGGYASTTVTVGSTPKCVWVCCELLDGGGCPTTDQCP